MKNQLNIIYIAIIVLTMIALTSCESASGHRISERKSQITQVVDSVRTYRAVTPTGIIIPVTVAKSNDVYRSGDIVWVEAQTRTIMPVPWDKSIGDNNSFYKVKLE